MCKNAPDHLVSRVWRVLDRLEFVYWNFLAWVVLRYCENIDGIHFQFLSFQSKANVTIYHISWERKW